MTMELDPLKRFFNRLFGRWSHSPNDQQYYVKIFFAMISAIICGLGGPVFAGTRGLMLGLLIYVLALFVIRYLLEVSIDKLGGMRQLVTNSLPSYLLLWIVLWTIMWAFWPGVGQT